MADVASLDRCCSYGAAHGRHESLSQCCPHVHTAVCRWRSMTSSRCMRCLLLSRDGGKSDSLRRFFVVRCMCRNGRARGARVCAAQTWGMWCAKARMGAWMTGRRWDYAERPVKGTERATGAARADRECGRRRSRQSTLTGVETPARPTMGSPAVRRQSAPCSLTRHAPRHAPPPRSRPTPSSPARLWLKTHGIPQLLPSTQMNNGSRFLLGWQNAFYNTHASMWWCGRVSEVVGHA
jgi:hypothetical protein